MNNLEENEPLLRNEKAKSPLLDIHPDKSIMEDYVKGFEKITLPIIELLKEDVDDAENSGYFEELGDRLPDILDIIDSYSQFGGYYQACSELLRLYAKIERGLGDLEQAQETEDVLDHYINQK